MKWRRSTNWSNEGDRVEKSSKPLKKIEKKKNEEISRAIEILQKEKESIEERSKTTYWSKEEAQKQEEIEENNKEAVIDKK